MGSVKQMTYVYLIDSVGLSGGQASLAEAPVVFGAHLGGGNFECPKHQPGGGEVEKAGRDYATHFGAIAGQIGRGCGYTQARDAELAASSGHGVEPGAGVEVVTAAGASADGRALAAASVRERMAAETDDEVRVHEALHRVDFPE